MTKTIALIAALVLAPAGIAQAQDAALTRIVATADLNLSTAHGRAQLDSRIARSVEAVCGRRNNLELSKARLIKRCATDAMAVASVQRDRMVARAGTRIEVAAR